MSGKTLFMLLLLSLTSAAVEQSLPAQKPAGEVSDAPAVAEAGLTGVTFTVPSKNIKLDDDAGRACVLAAGKVAVLVFGQVDSTFRRSSKDVLLVIRPSGIRREVDVQKTFDDVLHELAKWQRFTVVDDLRSADLILVFFEQVVPPGPMFMLGDKHNKLKDNLMVYKGGEPFDPRPLWAASEKENVFTPFARMPAKKLVEQFRRDLEQAEQKKK